MLKKNFWQKSGIELVALFVGGLGLFLMVAQVHISVNLERWGWLLVGVAKDAVKNIPRLTTFDILGLVLLSVSTVVVVARLRYRLRTSQRYVALNCPCCSSKVRRSHRQPQDYIINRFVPVYRYKCRNRECGWVGLRVLPLFEAQSIERE